MAVSHAARDGELSFDESLGFTADSVDACIKLLVARSMTPGISMHKTRQSWIVCASRPHHLEGNDKSFRTLPAIPFRRLHCCVCLRSACCLCARSTSARGVDYYSRLTSKWLVSHMSKLTGITVALFMYSKCIRRVCKI